MLWSDSIEGHIKQRGRYLVSIQKREMNLRLNKVKRTIKSINTFLIPIQYNKVYKKTNQSIHKINEPIKPRANQIHKAFVSYGVPTSYTDEHCLHLIWFWTTEQEHFTLNLHWTYYHYQTWSKDSRKWLKDWKNFTILRHERIIRRTKIDKPIPILSFLQQNGNTMKRTS